ncbi:MAG: methyltransferase domain-containing protein [Patescibacteria group bacterium]
MAFADPTIGISKLALGEGMSVLDVGAGSGAYSHKAAELVGPSGRVFALDVQKDLLQRLRAESVKNGAHQLETIWADAEIPGGTKLIDASVDVAILSNTLFQVEKKETVLREIFRVLRKAGKLLLIDWKDSFGGVGPHERDVCKREDALALSAKVGFNLLQEFDPGDHHYGFIFRKP